MMVRCGWMYDGIDVWHCMARPGTRPHAFVILTGLSRSISEFTVPVLRRTRAGRKRSELITATAATPPRTDHMCVASMVSAMSRSRATAPAEDATTRPNGSSPRRFVESAPAGAIRRKKSAKGARSGEARSASARTAPTAETASAAPASAGSESDHALDLLPCVCIGDDSPRSVGCRASMWRSLSAPVKHAADTHGHSGVWATSWVPATPYVQLRFITRVLRGGRLSEG